MAQPAAGNGAHPDPMSAKPVPFVHVYFAFAAGYLLSYLLRTVNAVISPELTRELGLTSSSLGLLTSAYFIAFGAMQIPAGMLLDRYGPRRVEPALLLFCGIGTLAFALADGVTGLIVARALIGLGVSVVPDGAAEGDLRVVPGRAAGVARRLDHGRRRRRGAGGDHAARDRAAVHATGAACSSALSVFAFGVAAWIWWRVPDTAPPAASGGHRHAVGRRARPCSRTRASGGSRRWARSAWARSWRSRDCGRCRG